MARTEAVVDQGSEMSKTMLETGSSRLKDERALPPPPDDWRCMILHSIGRYCMATSA